MCKLCTMLDDNYDPERYARYVARTGEDRASPEGYVNLLHALHARVRAQWRAKYPDRHPDLTAGPLEPQATNPNEAPSQGPVSVHHRRLR